MLEKYRQYLEARQLSVNYFNTMRQFLAYLQEKNIEFSAITQESITDFFNSRPTYSASTRNQFIKACRHYAQFLGIVDSAFTKIRLMKTDRKIPDYLTEEDLQKAIKYMATYHSDLYSSDKISAILFFLFYTGIRKGELLALKRADINLEEGVAKIWGQKSKAERFVYFPAKVNHILVKYFKQEEEKDNCFNLTLRKIDYICVLLRKYFPQRNIKVHLFRHSGARYMIEKGLPVGVVQKILGHASPFATMIYIDPDRKMVERMYKDKIR
jgi:site-specific recombinase XerD